MQTSTIIEFFGLCFAFLVLILVLIGMIAYAYYWLKAAVMDGSNAPGLEAFDQVMELQKKHIGF